MAGARAWQESQQEFEAADSGIITALELCSVDLRGTELAVLSACDTGRGDRAKGQGVAGLVRAFAFAGAKRVLLSLWQVDDIETSHLMITFYSALSSPEACTYAEALLIAQKSLRQQGLSPHYWGAFVLYSSTGTKDMAMAQWARQVLLSESAASSLLAQ